MWQRATFSEARGEYVDTFGTLWYFYCNGAVAQMGERVTGSHKVVGSIPISSTNKIKGLGFLPNPFILYSKMRLDFSLAFANVISVKRKSGD